MANNKLKSPKNIAGKYYVDNTCIGCGLCCDIASDYFVEDGSMMYVKQQPLTSADVALCEEALGSCPVEAIGNDGDTE